MKKPKFKKQRIVEIKSVFDLFELTSAELPNFDGKIIFSCLRKYDNEQYASTLQIPISIKSEILADTREFSFNSQKNMVFILKKRLKVELKKLKRYLTIQIKKCDE